MSDINQENIVEKPKKLPRGRPRNGQFTDKELLERRLKSIWSKTTKHAKASEIIAAASLYAELKGWKIKKPEISEEGEVMRIEFQKDLSVQNKAITAPPINKLIETSPIIKEITTTTTTQPIVEEVVKIEFE